MIEQIGELVFAAQVSVCDMVRGASWAAAATLRTRGEGSPPRSGALSRKSE